jgi:hypothetical protein
MTLAIVLIAAGLILISMVSAAISQSRQKTTAARFSRRFGLEVPPGIDQALRLGLQARRIGGPIGTVAGVSIAMAFLLIFPGFPLLAAWWCLFGSYLLGAGLGATVATFIAEGRRESGVVRVARTTAVTVGDYVPPYQSVVRWFGVIVAGGAFAADCWLAATDSGGYLSIVSGVLLGLAVLTLLVYEVVVHRVIRRGALAGTPLELAWDDALRSYALVNFNGLVALIALYSVVAYNTLVASATPHMASEPAYGVFVGLLPIAASAAIFILVGLMTSVGSRQHFLRRLWPQLAEEAAAAAPAAAFTTPPEIMGTR